MIYNLVEHYSDIVSEYEVFDFRRYGTARALVAGITFLDGSMLHIRDYLFADGQRKYSFHWQTRTGQLICRWDSSPHHPQVTTFPHHLHTAEGMVLPSQVFSLDKVLETIAARLRG